MKEVKLKKLAADVNESLVVRWRVTEGDIVHAGDVLVEVQTEKAMMEMEAEEDGMVAEILVPRGESAKVGDVLVKLKPVERQTMQTEKTTDRRRVDNGERQKSSNSFVGISPKLRRLARQLSVEIQDIRGTGKNQQVTEEDIERAAKKKKPSHSPALPFTGMRRRIARRMMESLQTSAQVTMTNWADVTELEAEQKAGNHISWTALIVKAVTTTLLEHPKMNAYIKDDLIYMHPDIHLAIAIETEGGVQVPVLRFADKLAVEEIHQQITSLAEKARKRSLSIDESSGSTFTITNLGGYSVEFFTPILNPPEAGILGVGKIESYLVMEDGVVTERKRMPLSLTFDHRAIDGAPAARFLHDVSLILGQPESLLPKVYEP